MRENVPPANNTRPRAHVHMVNSYIFMFSLPHARHYPLLAARPVLVQFRGADSNNVLQAHVRAEPPNNTLTPNNTLRTEQHSLPNTPNITMGLGKTEWEDILIEKGIIKPPSDAVPIHHPEIVYSAANSNDELDEVDALFADGDSDNDPFIREYKYLRAISPLQLTFP